MWVVFFTVLACAVLAAQCMLVHTTEKAYDRDAAQIVCIAIVSGTGFMWVVFLTAAACTVFGTMIWLGVSIRRAFGETDLVGMCAFASFVVSFLALSFLVVKEVLD